MELKEKLRKHLEENDLASVIELFEDDGRFTKRWSGFSRQQLANVVFDETFRTPLHIAVAQDSVELVQYLVLVGAKPKRNFAGYLPWERFGFVPRCSAAARAARTPLRGDSLNYGRPGFTSTFASSNPSSIFTRSTLVSSRASTARIA